MVRLLITAVALRWVVEMAIDHETHRERLKDYSEKSGHKVDYNDGGVLDRYEKENPNFKAEFAYEAAGRTPKEKADRSKEILERNVSSKGSRGREAKENKLGLHMEMEKIRDKTPSVGGRKTKRLDERSTKREYR